MVSVAPSRRRSHAMPVTVRAALLGAALALGAVLAAACTVSTAFAGLPVGRVRRSSGTVAAAGHSAVARQALQTLERTKQSSEWRLSVGHAIDVLRTDLQLFADAGHTPDFSIFSEDIVVEDARLPSFRLRGLASYQRVLSTLKWSLSAACDQSRMEITAMQPPVNNELYVRWRLHLLPRDVFASAKDFLSPALGEHWAQYSGEPLIVEGYSRYEFDPWTAEIVKHTIDITNPPMFIVDLLRKQQPGGFVWAPMGGQVGVPSVMPLLAGMNLLESEPA